MGSSTPNTYLSVQILDEVLKKKESYKQHCQAEALCKFDCCRPMNLLYVDLDIVHHLDSAILIFRPCHWHLPCWYHPDSVILIFHPCHWHLSYWYHPDSAILIFHRCHWYLPYWCHQCHQLVFSSGINIPSSSLPSNLFYSVMSLSVLQEVTLEKRRTGFAGNFFG